MVILIILASIALAVYLHRPLPTESTHGVVAIQKEIIVVHYPGNTPGKLQRKAIEIHQQLPDKLKADTLFRALKDVRCVPIRVRLYDMARGPDGVIYLNVSREFLERTEPECEMTMVYCLVNSFLESFRDAKAAQILVEDQPIYSRSGLLYLFEPLQFNKELLED